MPVLKRRRRADRTDASSPSGQVSASTRFADLPEFLHVKELAVLWRVSPSTIYELIKRGELHAHHMGTMVRIPREQALRRARERRST
jgi:excisionase family DNA binding protein